MDENWSVENGYELEQAPDIAKALSGYFAVAVRRNS